MNARRPVVNTSPVANQYGGADEKIIEYSQNGTGAGGLISFSVNAAGRLVVNLYRHDAYEINGIQPEIRVNGVAVPPTTVTVHRAAESPTWTVTSPRGQASAASGVVADLVWEEVGSAGGAVVRYQDEDSITARLARRCGLDQQAVVETTSDQH